MADDRGRDRAVERLLQQSLRAHLGPEIAGTCLDAETVAAWAEGSLSGKARETAEAHVSTCVRCQEMAAALIRTTPAPATPSGVTSPRWWQAWRLNWLVPLTAAGVAVAVWVLLPATRPTTSPVTLSTEAQPAAPARDEPADARRNDVGAISAPAAKPAAPARSETKTETRDQLADNRQVDELEARNKVAAPVAREAAASAGALRAESAPAATPSAAATSAAATPSAAAPPAAAAPTAPAASAQTAERSAAMGKVAGVAGSMDNAAAVRDRSALSPEVVSPDGSVRWRIVRPSSVQRSTDSGVTWETLSTGATSELMGGSSPSASVCWLVGRGGAVLLSTDGRRWARVAFPEAVDLLSVQATDARTAIVTTVDGRRFRTTDGGNSWVPA